MTHKAAGRSERYPFDPDYAVPPGRTLQETIDSRGMDQRDLATRTGLSPKHINQIIQGVASITQDTAIRLERVTGVPARFWNNLETNYREQLAKLDEKRRLSAALSWLKGIPTAELEKRGKIRKESDPITKLRSVLGFFGVANIKAWKELWLSPQVAYRKSAAFQAKPGARATWLRLGELEAQSMECKPFDRTMFRKALDLIRELTVKSPELFETKMKSLCANAGVAVVLVPEIKGAPASGAARWLKSEKAMIQLSLRYKANDQFWFSFFHEAGHILNDGKKEVFIDVDHNDDEREKAANHFAANFLIPVTRAKELPTLTNERAVKKFARWIGIAPGIVVGRLQHDGVVGYHKLNVLKLRFQWAANE